MGTTPAPFPVLQPGVSAKYQVALTFSTGTAFAPDPTRTLVTSSDPTNFPVSLDPTDPTIIDVVIPTDAAPVAGADGGEDIKVVWQYTNLDGEVVQITGTVTEFGITDDITGGTFTRIA